MSLTFALFRSMANEASERSLAVLVFSLSYATTSPTLYFQDRSVRNYSFFIHKKIASRQKEINSRPRQKLMFETPKAELFKRIV